MNSQPFPWFFFLHLPSIISLFQSCHGSGNPEVLYKSCANNFSCGANIAQIGYPFRGSNDPAYCGHPSFILSCNDQTHETTISMMDTRYRVLRIDQIKQTMSIVRVDVVVATCPADIVNTTLDYSLFEYASTYTNLTFFYGCPPLKPPGLSFPPCAPNRVYVLPGTQGPGKCNASVTVPVTGNVQVSRRSFNASYVEQALQQGLEVRWKMGSKACSDCTESKGRCGYDFITNGTNCFCPHPPYVSKACSIASQSSPDNIPPSGKGGSRTGMTIGLTIAGIAGASIGLGILIFCCKKRRKQRHQRLAVQSSHTVDKDITAPPSSEPLSTPDSSNFTRSTPSYPSSNSDLAHGSSYFGAHVFDFAELEAATDNFNSSRELGDGGFGTVYYGVLRDGREVAVKLLYESNYRRLEQFMNEVKILTQLQHANLVTLYGCTSKRSRELLLVYEYIPNGTVADHLHGKHAQSGLPSWPVRMNIAIETAGALTYLHKSEIIHRDVKTNNILLGKNFHVKVADFGLSRLFPNDVTHVSTAPQGTPGYVDPEYYQCYHLTEKSDVYSFGVVLIELISSLQAVDISRHRHDINLGNMAVNKIQNRTLHELVDSNLGFETNSSIRRMVTLVAELAFQCLQQERDMRPTMQQVLEALKEIQNDDIKTHKVDILVDSSNTEPPKSSTAPTPPDSAPGATDK